MTFRDKSGRAETRSTLSPGGEDLFGWIPIWLNILGGLVLVVMLCLLIFL
jgi:hypothetical protein